MRLIREIRCFASDDSGRVTNSWAGTGEGSFLGAHWVLRAMVDGPVDPRTGYLCDIKVIDHALRTIIAPALRKSAGDAGSLTKTLSETFAATAEHFSSPLVLHAVELRLSPHTRFTVVKEGSEMMRLTQSFEFSAAHRLFCTDLSDAENRRLFGKCSNPNGHGHNYVLEVTVAGPVRADLGTVADIAQVDRVVLERVIEPFDHKNLNLECPDFARLNPSVENIARVIWDRLEGAFVGCRLTSVRVWETPKTCAEYTGGDQT